MWPNFALAVALIWAPGGAEQLTISNIRGTYGLLGSQRPDNKLLPGDVYVIQYDIEGLKADSDGKVQFSMEMEVKDSKDKVIFKAAPRNQEVVLSLGGSRAQASTYVKAGFNQPAGQYTVTVSVVDKATKAKQSFSRTIVVLEKDFGIVWPYTSADTPAAWPCAQMGVTGQYLVLNFGVVGFQRDAKTQQPSIKVEMQILDEKENPTLGKPFTGEVINGIPAQGDEIPMQFQIGLNRAGKFTIVLKATDRVANKVAKKITLPLTVYEQKATNPE
jgi:hypothetical protein